MATNAGGIRIGLLGPIVVEIDGDPTPLAAPRRRAVLAALALDVGRAVSADRLLDAVWGDDFPATGTRAVAYQISKLRDLLEPDRQGEGGCITTTTAGYTLDLAGDAVDVNRLDRLVEEARKRLGDDPARSRLLAEEAAGLVRGEPLADLGDEPFVAPMRHRLVRRVREGRLVLAEAVIEAGSPAAAVDDLASLVDDEPLDEAAVALLMTALHRSGRTGEGLRAYNELRRRLGEELGIEPATKLRRLESTLLAVDDSGDDPSPEVAVDRPAAARIQADSTAKAAVPASPLSFVGRAKEAGELRDSFAVARLVTITGFGGIGKTSLARHVARTLADDGTGPVWFIDLTPVPDPTLVVETIIAAAGGGGVTGGRPPIDELVALLGEATVALVLDNCEHLLDTQDRVDIVVEVVEELLARVPTLRILATSRHSLGVAGEVVRPLAPLDDASTLELFVDRAALAQPGFRVESSNQDAVERIAASVDGIPLAAEMAAARLTVMGVDELADNLVDRLPLLSRSGRGRADGQQRSMRAVLDWSTELLDRADQRLLGRLATCVDGFDLAAATAFGGVGDVASTADALARVVEAGLVTAAERHGRLRHSIPEVVRQHATGRLTAVERAEAERAHARHYSAVAAEIDDLWSRGDQSMLAVGERELGNLRAAIGWSYRNGAARQGLAIVLGARFFFWSKMMNRETLGWLAAGLELIDDRFVDEDDSVVLDAAAATVTEAFNVGDHRAAERAIALVERVLPHVVEPTLRAALFNALGTNLLEVDPWAADRHYANALEHSGLPKQRILALLNNRTELSWLTGRLADGDGLLRQLDATIGLDEAWPAMAIKIRAIVAAREERWDDVIAIAGSEDELDPANRASVVIATAEALEALGRLDEAQRALDGLDLVAHGHYVRNADLVAASISLMKGEPGVVPGSMAELVAWLNGQDRRLAMAAPVAALLGTAAIDLGDAASAACLLGFAEAERSRLGTDLRPTDRSLAADAIERCRAALGDESFDALTARGAALDFGELPTTPGDE